MTVLAPAIPIVGAALLGTALFVVGTYQDHEGLSIKIVVIGLDGRPVAGIPVGWARPGYWLCDKPNVLTTGPDGIATLRTDHAEEFRDLAHDVGLAFPHLEDVRDFVPAGKGADNPIVLRMPPTRRVELEIVDEHGQAVEGLGVISLHLYMPGTKESDSDSRCLYMIADVRDGRAVFPWVGAGSLSFEGRVGSRRIGRLDEDVYSPLEILSDRDGLTLMRVTAGPSGPELRGRLLFPDGIPAMDRQLDVYQSWFNPYISHCYGELPPPFARVRTDEGGRFRVHVPAVSESAWTVPAISDEFGGTAFAIPIHLNELEPSGGPFDVGDAVLIEAALLAAGRVLDNKEQPVANVELGWNIDERCWKNEDVTDLRAPSLEHESRQALVERPQSSRTRSDGSFELRYFVVRPAGDVNLSVHGTRVRLRVPIGTRGVEIRLQ